MLPSGTRFMLFASCVVVIAAVDRTIGTRIVSDRARNMFDLVDVIQAPTAVLSGADAAQHHESVKQIKFREHQSLSVFKIGWSVSAQRERSKLMALKVRNATGMNRMSKPQPKNPNTGTSRKTVTV